MLCKSSPKELYNRRICLDFTVYCFYVILFRLFESLFGIFTFFGLANRPLFAATKQCKSPQKQLSTKLEIKFKQILNQRQQKTATWQKCNCISGSRCNNFVFMANCLYPLAFRSYLSINTLHFSYLAISMRVLRPLIFSLATMVRSWRTLARRTAT